MNPGYQPPPSTSYDGSLSTISDESMVEIKRIDTPPNGKGSHVPQNPEEEKYRLIYSKSKVYVHSTAYARDNIPGFVVLVKREAVNPTYLLAWIPESLLNEKGQKEWDKFTKIENHAVEDDEDEDGVLINLPTQRPETYAFSVALSSIYSLIVHAPTLSSWHGSLAINLISGSTLPTLYFHDDESPRSFHATLNSPPINRRNSSSASYPPKVFETRSTGALTTWGGEDLISKLRSYAHLLRSTLQPSVYLVDPSKADIDTHTTQLFADDAVDDILSQSSYANSYSPVPAHRRPRPLSTPMQPTPLTNPYSHKASVLHRSLQPTAGPSSPRSQARAALLQSFSNITRATRHAAQNILSHPLAKPIIPHLPDPVKSLVNARGENEWSSILEKGGVGEFESARVYLARWARIVAEEGEKNRMREARAIPAGSADSNATDGGTAGEEGSLGVFELLHSTVNLPKPRPTRDPQHPIEEETWLGWFAKDGRPRVRKEEMRREVFRRGVSQKGTLRKRVWPFVLGVMEWDLDDIEREKKWEAKRAIYHELRNQWDGVDEVFNRPDIIEERHRIDVDCRRTDRTQPLFMTQPSSFQMSRSSSGSSSALSNTDQGISETRRFSNITPEEVVGAQAPTNDHVERLSGILLTYNIYEKELGYVQGMSDLCAPIYVVMGGDEEMTFWCFVEVMNRMKQNFLRDQSGMKKQLLTLQQLISMMDPELYRHLEKTDGLNLFFCFRWVLITFKREFPFEDVLRLWEVLWTNYYSNQFVLFVVLAVLESHRDVILRYLVEFDEVLKYCNDLSMTIELDSTLAQAEVLFLSFTQLIADVDRRRAEANSDAGPLANMEVRRRAGHQRGTSKGGEARGDDAGSTTTATASAVTVLASNLPTISENLRELLQR